jgi:2-polyprenyl-3-methyl-5-hydroxy-6-metoxy-1,4-benzoquinol methylase
VVILRRLMPTFHRRLRNLAANPRPILTNYRNAAVTYAKVRAKPHILAALRRGNERVRAVSARTHAAQHHLDWTWPPAPEWFDHHVEAHMRDATHHNISEERGVFTSWVVPTGGRVLDLCCGDGYYSRRYYTHRASEVVGVDFDPNVIDYARSTNGAANIRFEVADARQSLPDGPFDVVAWNGAIEHFTETEVIGILRNIQARLADGGILAGDTPMSDGAKLLVHHEREYASPSDLLGVLRAVFPHACVWTCESAARTELYFYAADDERAIPFAPSSPRVIIG